MSNEVDVFRTGRLFISEEYIFFQISVQVIINCLIAVHFYNIEYVPVHEIPDNVVCATSKASDQPARTRSLIGAFASRLCILCLLSY